MPYAVAAIALASFLAGVAVANARWGFGGWFVALAVGLALWLRSAHFSEWERAFIRGVEYAHATSNRVRDLQEVTEISPGFAEMAARIRTSQEPPSPEPLG